MPSTRQADPSRAPDRCASEISSTITSRSACSCRRPRPPHTGCPLFFENEQRRSFSQRLLFASELALELANTLVGRCRGCATLIQSNAPLLVLGELHPFAFQVGGQLLGIELGTVGENTDLWSTVHTRTGLGLSAMIGRLRASCNQRDRLCCRIPVSRANRAALTAFFPMSRCTWPAKPGPPFLLWNAVGNFYPHVSAGCRRRVSGSVYRSGREADSPD